MRHGTVCARPEPEALSRAMDRAVERVLETMCYAPVYAFRRAEERKEDSVRVTVAFAGPLTGVVCVTVPWAAAISLSADFLGAVDTDGVTRERTLEVMGEIGNMICGATLTALASDCLFQLGHPKVSMVSDGACAPATPDLARSYDFCGDVFSVALSLEA